MNEQVLAEAVKLAREVGYRNVTRKQLAERLDKSLSWLRLQGSHTDVLAYLEQNAQALGLSEGEQGATNASRGRSWVAANANRVLEAAYDLADEQGLMNMTRKNIANRAGVGTGTVTLRWGGMDQLRAAVADLADQRGNESLLNQARALGILAA